MKRTVSRALVTVKPEVAKAFLPKDMHKNGVIDLTALAAVANDAIVGSEESLVAAQAILNDGLLSRWINSGEMQRHVIQAITHIRDISKVNLGLSAICNDLAMANLEHARRIDANHHATNTGLNEVKTLTSDLLEHLRRPREQSLLDSLMPALGSTNLADHDAMRGWLRSLSEAIDLQYSSLQVNVKLLTEQQAPFAEWVDRVNAEVSSLDASVRRSLQDQTAESVRQLGLLSLRLEESLQQATSQTNRVESLFRTSHNKLGDGLTKLNLHLNKLEAEVKIAIGAERASRDLMKEELSDMVIQREGAIRRTISELNQHLLKRMLWAAGALLILQVAGFAFLSIKMGLWS